MNIWWSDGLNWLEDFLRGQAREKQWVQNSFTPQYVYNSVTNKMEVQRTANVTKPFSFALPPDGTVIWTPAAGKRFRVMGWFIVSNGVVGTYDDGVGGTQVLPGRTSNGVFQGNGYLSSKPNNQLVTKGMGALGISGIVWGTEE